MYIRHRNRRLRVSEISSNTDQNDASFLMNDAVTGVEANIVQAKSLYRSREGRLLDNLTQHPRIDLNKRFLSRPNTTIAYHESLYPIGLKLARIENFDSGNFFT